MLRWIYALQQSGWDSQNKTETLETSLTITVDENENENESPQNKTENAENTCIIITIDEDREAAWNA